MEHSTDVTVAQLDDFDEVIDVRSPAEFELDRIAGATNCPVLDDGERARVGTLHNQHSPFHARLVGAALVARNIARMLDTQLHDRPHRWRPLVYCWRGGGRSDALREVLRRVGWRAERLQGGYRAYRRAVLEDLQQQPRRFDFRVLCGRTGAGKSQVLQSLSELGAQVLDLEQLARHRGSVLGELPGDRQPTQKLFESLLWRLLRQLDPSRPVFIEAESRKIGNLQVPGALMEAMRASPCIVVQAELDVRVELLLQQYGHFTAHSDLLGDRLNALASHYGRATIERWCDMARAERHADLVAELLSTHYDPAYDRSLARNFVHAESAEAYELGSATASALRTVAESILARRAEAQPTP